MRSISRFTFAFVLAGLVGTARSSTMDGEQLFTDYVEPMLRKHCYECHSHSAKKIKGGLVVDSRGGLLKGGDIGPAIVPGKPEKSLLLEAISYKDPDLEMPPTHRLTEQEVMFFRQWIAAGAPDPRKGPEGIALPSGEKKPYPVAASELWSLKPVANPPVPAVKDKAWPRGDIDRFILAKLEEKGVRPVSDAVPERLLRRMVFDLTGLPPTPGEVASFLNSHQSRTSHSSHGTDGTNTAYVALTDRLLASPRFGERWGRHWLDTARYADTNGGDRDRPLRYAFRYRDWVIDAINADMPYDRFLTEQLAGDLLPADDWRQRERQQIGTGFLAVGSRPLPEIGVNPQNDAMKWEKVLPDWENDMIDATTRGMLGLGVACARCHDHKFDPIPQKDFYALAGIFRSTEVRSTATPFQIPGLPDPHYPFEPWQWITGEPENVSSAEEMIARWNQMEADRRPLRTKVKALGSKLRNAEDLKRKRPESLTADERRQLAGIDDLKKELAEIEPAYIAAGTIEEPVPEIRLAAGAREAGKIMDVPVLTKGEWDKKGEVVPRGFLTSVPVPGDFPIPKEESGRVQLARWITHPENPLTARVAVNRVWHQLFGLGIVSTLDNFGITGAKPTHPELLDWLAHRFVHEHGWSVKKLVREIVLSRTYQLACIEDDEAFAKDPSVELYWRARPRRLEAEAVRDAMLAIAGRLDLSRPITNPLEKTRYVNNTNADKEAQQVEDGNLRSVYVPIVRGKRTEMQGLFDQPVPEEVNSERNVSTLPTQTLFLLNAPYAKELIAATATRVLNDSALGDDTARLTRAYQLILARNPTTAELVSDQELLASMPRDKAWPALCLSMLMSSEFFYRF